MKKLFLMSTFSFLLKLLVIGLTDSKIVGTQVELNQKPSASKGTPLLDPTRYRQPLHSLIY